MELPPSVFNLYSPFRAASVVTPYLDILNGSSDEKHNLLSEPLILSCARYLAADMIARGTNGAIKLNQKWGINGRGLLWDEEVENILEHDVRFSPPAVFENNIIRPAPSQFHRVNNLMYGLVPELCENGILVGIASGCFDVLHAGHIRFLSEMFNYFIENHPGKPFAIVLGVDENELVFKVKGANRPYNDFTVRVTTICNLPFLRYGNAFVFRVSKQLIDSNHTLGMTNTPFPLCGVSYDFSRSPEGLPSDKFDSLRHKLYTENTQWVDTVGARLFYFFTGGDPFTLQKRQSIEVLGGSAVEIPKRTQLSTTDLAEWYNLKQSPDMPDKFESFNYNLE